MGAQFQAFAGGVWVDIPQMGNAGGQFGRGWNDVSVEFVVTEKKSVDLGVKSNWGKDIWWGTTRFRLVKLAGTESANISISSPNILLSSLHLRWKSLQFWLPILWMA